MINFSITVPELIGITITAFGIWIGTCIAIHKFSFYVGIQCGKDRAQNNAIENGKIQKDGVFYDVKEVE